MVRPMDGNGVMLVTYPWSFHNYAQTGYSDERLE